MRLGAPAGLHQMIPLITLLQALHWPFPQIIWLRRLVLLPQDNRNADATVVFFA